MPDPETTALTPEEDLQFDQAEFEQPTEPTAVCTSCRDLISDEYYELNGTVLCGSCRAAIDRKPTTGERLARFFRATAFGLMAATAGFAIYYGVAKITGLELGLISILVGLMVGKAVHQGSGMRGGWVYQTLAVFLTYSAIAASYSAMVLPDLIKTMAEPQKTDAAGKDASGKAQPDVAKPPQAGEPEDEPVSLGKAVGFLVLLVIAVVGFAYAIPIIAGFSSPIGLLIIGFAIWEAWKLNRRVALVVNGPFRVGASGLGDGAGRETVHA